MRERTPASTGQKFFTAGLAGCMGWGVVHPFNTCAVRMNLATVKGQSFGSFFMQSVRKPGGLKSLYDGLSAGLIRQMFYASSRFALFEILRDEAAKHTPTTIWTRLGVGCAQVVAARPNLGDGRQGQRVLIDGKAGQEVLEHGQVLQIEDELLE